MRIAVLGSLLCMAWFGLLVGCARVEKVDYQVEYEAVAPSIVEAEAIDFQYFIVEDEHGEVQLIEEFVPRRTERVPAEERLVMGVSHAVHDNIGAILQAFSNDVDFEIVNLTGRDGYLEGLSALFINCGVSFNPTIIRNFVSSGGIVYASDLTSSQLIEAFPSKFVVTGYGSSGLINNAQIVHTGLASQMGTDAMDIMYNLGGWSQVDVICENVTVFITGLYHQRVQMPLAFSFDYGEGRVFYTTFHNNAQASKDMIAFIEYLVFSILNIEADRYLETLFEREGFVLESSNFARFGVTFADVMDQAGLAIAEEAGGVQFFGLEPPSVASPGAAGEIIEIERPTERRFVHNFNQGENILVIVDSADEGFTLLVEDPAGNIFEVRQEGIRLSNVMAGSWSFTIIPDDVYTNHTFTLGVGRQP